MNYAYGQISVATRHDDLKRVFFAHATSFDRIYIHGGCKALSSSFIYELALALKFSSYLFIIFCNLNTGS